MTGAVNHRRAAVLGHPVAHSLSPVLHRAAYAALGLAGWEYDAIDVTQEGLPAFVAALDGSWAGLSLTMPLKQTIMRLLDHVEQFAEVVGAVNTVLVQPGEGHLVLIGANTDVYGITAALGEARNTVTADVGRPGLAVRSAIVLGAGATAASAIAGLAQLGCTRVEVYARSRARAGDTMRAAQRIGITARVQPFEAFDDTRAALAGADVVVSTLPPGVGDDLAAGLVDPVRGVLLDCAYHPRPTALVTAWRRCGGGAVGGERMLVHQAAEQVRMMTGCPAPLDAMNQALVDALHE